MRVRSLAAAAFAWISVSAPGLAQDFGAAFDGFGGSSEEPIQIEADALEVRDAEKLAIYSGNVRARQGETLLQAPEMHVFYSGRVDEAKQPGSGVSRIEAYPDVVVSSVDQTATGDHMVIDMNADLITMTGNVVLTEGMNVVRGDRLVVNMTTKKGRVEGGRVQTLITPSGGRRPAQ
jgi:lipopolysaccharide export system protein LptA